MNHQITSKLESRVGGGGLKCENGGGVEGQGADSPSL